MKTVNPQRPELYKLVATNIFWDSSQFEIDPINLDYKERKIKSLRKPLHFDKYI